MHGLVSTVAWLQPLKLSVFEDENLGNGLNHNFISYQPSTDGPTLPVDTAVEETAKEGAAMEVTCEPTTG